jgi:hypothetical protein
VLCASWPVWPIHYLGLDRPYERSLAEYAADGHFELYKTTAEHDGEVRRGQHGFPSQEEVAM